MPQQQRNSETDSPGSVHDGPLGALTPLSAKLDLLYAVELPEGSDQPFTYSQVARAIGDMDGGGSVSDEYLRALHTGKQENPSARVIGWLAKFWQKPLFFFFPVAEAEPLVAELRFKRLGRAGVLQLAMRVADLPADGQAAVAAFAEEIWQRETAKATGGDDGGRDANVSS